MNAKQFALANPLVVVGGLIALYVVIRGASNVGKDLGNLVGSLGAGAVNGGASAAGQVAGELVKAPLTASASLGHALGVPYTDAVKCEQCKASGDSFGASQYCSAGDYLAWQAKHNPIYSLIFGAAK